MKTVHKTSTSKQGQETTTTEAPERMVASEILKALDIPQPASWRDREAYDDLAGARLAFVTGYVRSALKHDTMLTTMPALSAAAAEQFPVTYSVADDGGESR